MDLAEVHAEGSGEVGIAPKDSSRRQVVQDIQGALSANTMSTAQAAKTRGRSGWVGSNSFGKLGRLGLSVLKFLQYNKQRHLTTTQRHALTFHQHMITHIPPRRVSVVGVPHQPVIVYSDAEYAPGSGLLPRLGWVVFPADNGQPVGHTLLLPQEIWETWTHREQHISR